MSFIQDKCSICGRVSNLNNCFESNEKLCKRCMAEHFESYHRRWLPVCDQIEGALEFYKKQLGFKLFLNTLLVNLFIFKF